MNENTTVSERFISLQELAKLLSVNARTVYRLIQSGLIPKPVKIGHSVRFPVSDVEMYIEHLKESR